MREAASREAREFGGTPGGVGGSSPTRREPREPAVRLVEYVPFPRARRGQRWRVGFTRDVSPAGLCLRADGIAPCGSFLRIVIRHVDGRPTHDSIAQVVWWRGRPGCQAWVGLSLIARRSVGAGDPPPRRHALRDPRGHRPPGGWWIAPSRCATAGAGLESLRGLRGLLAP